MFKFIAFLALISAARANSIGVKTSSSERSGIIPLIYLEMDQSADGSFRFSYEGGDKSFHEESGVFENIGTDDETLEASDSYRYIDDNDQEIGVHYTTGKNGFVYEDINVPTVISVQNRAGADLSTEINERVVIRNVRDADEIERRQALKIERQIQKIEYKKNEKIDKQVAKINKIFDRADSIIMDAVS